jgi:acyl dehydratase
MATRTLHSPPRILPLYARTVAPLLPGTSLLPFLGGHGGELPELELTLTQMQVHPDRLAAYSHLCGLSLRDELPATYPHVLAFPLHLALMADRSFPFPAVGLVHITNRIVQHRPIRVGEKLELKVGTTPLQQHPRGRTFALVSEIRVGEELVWEDLSTMLRRGAGGAPAGRTAGSDDTATAGRTKAVDGASGGSVDAHEEPPRRQPPRGAVWRLPGDLGRRYAAVSGDRNPIHMHALSAKLFGFPRAIAHGMWTKARCLAALEQRLPDSFSVEVHFRRPILLPAQVAFAGIEEEEGIRFAVTGAGESDNETKHLDGTIEPLAGGTPGHTHN